MHDRPAGLAVMEQLAHTRLSDPARSGIDRLLGRRVLSDTSRPWYVGALGEIAVGNAIDSLPAPWSVFHSLPIGTRGADIDHLVVGPGGVFCLNTKNHRNARIWVANHTMMVNGHKQPYIRNSTHEARRLTTILRTIARDDLTVRAVIAVVGAQQITVRSKPEDVAVIAAPRLRRWLLAQPEALSTVELARIASFVEQPATWGLEAPSSSFAGAVQGEFAKLRTEVRNARRVRIAWSVGTLCAIPVAGVTALQTIQMLLVG
jgi:Nuclease-related domain